MVQSTLFLEMQEKSGKIRENAHFYFNLWRRRFTLNLKKSRKCRICPPLRVCCSCSNHHENVCLMLSMTEKKNEALLTALLFKPTLGVQWLPDDVKFSRTSSPLLIEVNIHTFGWNIDFIFYFYDIILSSISLNNDILE